MVSMSAHITLDESYVEIKEESEEFYKVYHEFIWYTLGLDIA